MISVIIARDKVKLQKQIKALEYLILNDNNDKDREIHEVALSEIKIALNKLNGGI